MPQKIWEEVDVDYSTSDTVRSRGEGGFRSPPYYSYFMTLMQNQYNDISVWIHDLFSLLSVDFVKMNVYN